MILTILHRLCLTHPYLLLPPYVDFLALRDTTYYLNPPYVEFSPYAIIALRNTCLTQDTTTPALRRLPPYAGRLTRVLLILLELTNFPLTLDLI